MDLAQHIEKCATTIDRSGTEYKRSFIFPATFPGFDGHFPGNPLLPGVIQTLIGELTSLTLLAELYPAESLRLQSVNRCKYLRPIRPGEELSLTLTLKTKALQHISSCRLTVGEEKAATYQLIFSPEIRS